MRNGLKYKDQNLQNSRFHSKQITYCLFHLPIRRLLQIIFTRADYDADSTGNRAEVETDGLKAPAAPSQNEHDPERIQEDATDSANRGGGASEPSGLESKQDQCEDEDETKENEDGAEKLEQSEFVLTITNARDLHLLVSHDEWLNG